MKLAIIVQTSMGVAMMQMPKPRIADEPPRDLDPTLKTMSVREADSCFEPMNAVEASSEHWQATDTWPHLKIGG